MNVSPISYNQRIPMKAQQQCQNGNCKPSQKQIVGLSPAATGVMTGVFAMGIGLAFDRVFAALFNMTRDIKTSLVLNGAVGVALGAYSYFQSKKIANEEDLPKL